jgi:hypothetical protein
VLTANATTLTVTVPAGASYQPVSVTTGGLTAYSRLNFNTTFSDPGQFQPTAFSSPITPLNAGSDPQAIYPIDIDGDGKTDLVSVSSGDYTVFVYRNTGNPVSPAFTLQSSFATSGYLSAITAGDLDGDGKPEIIIADGRGPSLTIYKNTGSPGTIVLQKVVSFPADLGVANVSIGDLNGDGKPEIVTANNNTNSLSVFTNGSTPGNFSFSSAVDWPVPSPLSIAIADFDGDGKPDLATESSSGNYAAVFRNKTATNGGTISFDTDTDIPTGTYPQGVAAGDLDGDGKPDLVIANSFDNTLTILQNTGSSGTISFTAVGLGSTGNYPQYPVIADFDGDGLPDIAVSDFFDANVSVLHNTSTAGNISVAANVDFYAGQGLYYLAAADLDGDGRPDIATANSNESDLALLRNTSVNEPTITSFTPTTASTATVVTITGANLGTATNVLFGGVPATAFTVVSSTTITATVGAGALGMVTVVTPIGAASADGFIYGLTPPVISGFTPATGTTGTAMTITGTGFTGITSLTLGGVAANSFTVQSDTQITAVVGTGATGDVAVTSPAGTASLSGFVYTAQPAPVLSLSAFTPSSGATNTNIVITGVNLTGATAVTFGGTQAQSFSVYSDTEIHAVVGAGSSGQVVVTGADGTDELDGFTYLPPAAPDVVTISSFSPQSGPTGTTITITGANLSNVMAVSFGGVPAASYNILSDESIQAVVASGASGQVKVTAPSSADSLAGFLFTYDTTRQSAFQLLTFTGSLADQQAQLKWQIRNDAVISSYTVLRGIDTAEMRAIGTVQALGKNVGNYVYTFTDPSPIAGAGYYQLKMNDSSVIAYSYSPVISLQPPASILYIYPNPVKYGFFIVDIPTNSKGASWFQLFDMNGRIMKVQEAPPGAQQARIDIPGFLKGTYKLLWSDGTHTASQSILVLQ